MSNNEKYYYTSFISYLKKNFGEKYGKIGLTLHTPCPNNPPCIFCNQTSFIPHTSKNILSVKDQIDDALPYLKKKYQTESFIAYFQDNTSTFGNIEYLYKAFQESVAPKNIKALAISTRPDNINIEILEMLKKASKNKPVWLELGLQSIHDSTLSEIHRGHDFNDFMKAFNLIRENTDFQIGVHMIIGLPNETDEMIYSSMKKLNRINPDYVKFHHLQVLNNTELEEYYSSGSYTPLTLEKYVELFCNSLSYLNKDIVIQRLLSRAHSNELIAPKWGINTEQFKKIFKEYMDKHDLYQGSRTNS
ncbi:MAG: TIGR01212 family radical SAM protein [Candidatus Delongbacteria bacterium]|jgi:radical SAM protein (TIGR01212 family)|nr:TIGR01212 family radical SAM protein [Candidatus Delongbacteria bacterium]